MSIQSRREEEKQARKDAIKNSAWTIFLRDGLNEAKISEIAKDCRLGLSTLYYYFKDKRQIVYSLMLDFKIDNNQKLTSLIAKRVTYREFLQGYINVHLSDIERFRFFVLADSYYNYHNQYDVSDPVLNEYDIVTRNNGNYLLACLSQGLDATGASKVDVAISMLLGFLRRFVLLPQSNWPKNTTDRDKLITNLHQLACVAFENCGCSLDEELKAV